LLVLVPLLLLLLLLLLHLEWLDFRGQCLPQELATVVY